MAIKTQDTDTIQFPIENGEIETISFLLLLFNSYDIVSWNAIGEYSVFHRHFYVFLITM